MLADPTARDIAVRELARTYNTPGYPDPWESVQDYQRVKRYTAEHPNQGSQAVSTAVNLPRERIRSWVDSDGRPDCVRAIQTAEEYGWLIDSWDTPEGQGLNRLAAWLLSSGSLSNEPYTPRWIADGCPDELRAAAHDINIRLRREDRDDDRPVEWVPAEHPVVLGRLLHLWTGLKGSKSEHETRFPRYPAYAPKWVAREFAQVYVQNRAIERDDFDKSRLQLNEHRTTQFRETFVNLLKRVVSNPEDIRGDSYPIYIVGDAITELTSKE